MDDSIIEEIDLVNDIKDYISNVEVKFANEEIRTEIYSAENNSFMYWKKKIGSSTTILDVRPVDDAYLKKAILG